MKRIVICIVLAAAIFAGGIGALYYTCHISDSILEGLRDTERLYTEGDIEGAAAAAAKVRENWDRFREVHIFTVDNDHALEITMSMARIESLLEREDEELVTECRVMSELVEVYKRETIPSVMNVV